jgi:PTS system mannose-specific IIA component
MKFILASHGRFAEGLLDSINMLLGPQSDIEAYGLFPEEEPARLRERLEAAIEGCGDDEVFFFTDLYFGSPFNRVVELARTRDLYHITGMNLPVLIEAIVARNGGASCEGVRNAAMAVAGDSVKDVRSLLAADESAEEEEEW